MGTKTCAFGTFGACVGEVVPTAHDICGDGLDTGSQPTSARAHVLTDGDVYVAVSH